MSNNSRILHPICIEDYSYCKFINIYLLLVQYNIAKQVFLKTMSIIIRQFYILSNCSISHDKLTQINWIL